MQKEKKKLRSHTRPRDKHACLLLVLPVSNHILEPPVVLLLQQRDPTHACDQKGHKQWTEQGQTCPPSRNHCWILQCAPEATRAQQITPCPQDTFAKVVGVPRDGPQAVRNERPLVVRTHLLTPLALLVVGHKFKNESPSPQGEPQNILEIQRRG
jgi:hypothetical protein